MHNIKGSIPCGIEPFIAIINIISSSFDLIVITNQHIKVIPIMNL